MPAKKAKPAKRRTSSQYASAVRAEHMFEADHDEAAFEKRLKKIAKPKPKPKAKAKPRTKAKAKRKPRR